ncbi:MAG: hypothetical protein JWP44_1243 [Mucilaginibacter sp.]|nr:hypothetical protein [Mucilaginibacter sp.]
MKVKIFFSALVLLVFDAAFLYAQTTTDPGLPCAGNDVDTGNCPLDTWVIALALAAVIFATFHLSRKQSRLRINQ